MVKKRGEQARSPSKFEEKEIFKGPRKTPTDGRYGWLVVFCSFICNMIVDGVQYTFGNFLLPISVTLTSSVAEVSLIGSLLSGFYNFSGPVAGALGNKFGFRMVAITGSIISAAGLTIAYFAPDVAFLYFFYGVLGGLGFGMIYMASVITTSIYFDKYRALAASLSVCGTGVGTFAFSPLGYWLVEDYGWRVALLAESGIILLCILCGLSFKPIETIAVIPKSKQPSEISVGTIMPASYPSEARRALPNEAYPTLKEALDLQRDDRRSTLVSLVPRLERASTQGSLGQYSFHMPLVSVVTSLASIKQPYPEAKENKCQKCCRVCCFNFWHCRCKQRNLNLGDRPMYRDDIFYHGSLPRLSRYGSSDLNYHLSVTRIPDPIEIEQHLRQKCCVCHHAFLRTCVTMTGLNLLRSKIFAFLCVSSFMYTMALFVPYVFIKKLALQHDIPEHIAIWLVSAIGISNTAGRLASGIARSLIKMNTALFALVCLFISGLCCFIFIFSSDLGCFFTFSCIFGFFTAPFISLRPIIIVEFLGLEKLTNAFGLVLLSQGVASILGPPVAGVIEVETGQSLYPIYMCGSLMLAASLSLLVSTLITIRRKTPPE